MPDEPEAPVRAAERRRATPVAVAVSLEHVDEEREGRAVAKLEPLDVEGKPRPASHHRLTAGAVDSLAHAGERRQRAGYPLNIPDPVELTQTSAEADRHR